MTARTQNRPHPSPPPHGQVLPPADSHLPTPALPRMDRSHRQQTPLSPRPPSPAWTGLIASRLLSPYARPPPHGQVSPPADSSLPPKTNSPLICRKGSCKLQAQHQLLLVWRDSFFGYLDVFRINVIAHIFSFRFQRRNSR